ncbi:MAG: hypothetical protein CME06_01865 [Gemmatimonadetes bacterium]|nr:hypothetical protein [Gemmatimonadota bacterium]
MSKNRNEWPLVKKAVFALFTILLVFATAEAGLRAASRIVRSGHASANPYAGAPIAHEELRILCLGDGFTEGAGTNRRHLSYPEQLARILATTDSTSTVLDESDRPFVEAPKDGIPTTETDFDFIVRAARGRGSNELLRELPRLLETIRPSLVLVLTGSTNEGYALDSTDFINFRLSRLRVYKGLKIALNRLRALVPRDSLPRLLREPASSGRAGDLQREKLLATVFEEDLRGIARICRAAGVTPVLQSYPNELVAGLRKGHAELVRRVAAEEKAIAVDHFSRWKSYRAKYGEAAIFSLDRVHPNGFGYGLMARDIAFALDDAGLVPRGIPSGGEVDALLSNLRNEAVARANNPHTRALLLYERGEIDEALALLVSLHRKQPANTAVSLELGTLYELLGHRSSVRRTYRATLDALPGSESGGLVKRRLDELDRLEELQRR